MDSSNRNKRYNEYMRHIKEICISNFAPPDFLQHTESPFKWVQDLVNEEVTSSDYLIKMEDYTNQGDSYSFEKFIPYLGLSFEYSLLQDFQAAKDFLQKMEDMLTMMQSNNDRLYSRIGLALEHIFLATKTNVLILENLQSAEIDLLKERSRNLKPISEMDSVLQAGILAVKAKFYLTCSTKTQFAKENMMDATRLDPNFATWKYWMGKILRKIRRDKKEKDPRDEMAYFTEAVQQDRDAKHVVFLAQAYREMSTYLQKNKDTFPDMAVDDIYLEVDELNEKSCDLYMESVQLNPSSAAICRRAGNGLMSLPAHFAKYRLAKKLLHDSETLSRNPVTYHILGTYYARYEKDQDKAVKYFQLTADNNMVYGYHELLRIKYTSNPDYDALEDLLKAEEALEYSSNLPFIQGDIGWYYLVFQNNFNKALEYFWKVIEKEENTVYMKKFYSYSFCVKGPLNIYKVMKEKIMDVNEEMRDDTMVKFLDKINSNIELLDNINECVSLARAQNDALRNLQWQRKKGKTNQVKSSESNDVRNGSKNPIRYRKITYKLQEERMDWRKEEENKIIPPSEKERTSTLTKKLQEERMDWRKEEKKIITPPSEKERTSTPTKKLQEERMDWRKEEKKKITSPSEKERTSTPTKKAAPENWRQECRKF